MERPTLSHRCPVTGFDLDVDLPGLLADASDRLAAVLIERAVNVSEMAHQHRWRLCARAARQLAEVCERNADTLDAWAGEVVA